MVRAVLFDMDGLLIDSERIYTDVVNEILKPHGKEQTWDIKARLMGKPERDATRTLRGAHVSGTPVESVAAKSRPSSRCRTRVQSRMPIHVG